MQVLGWILLFGAAVGHTAICTWALNNIYGRALPHRVLSLARKLAALLVVAGVGLFALVLGPEVVRGAAFPWRERGYDVLGVYAPACCCVGLGIVPAVTLRRLLRRRPAALHSNHTWTVDVAARLGYKPVGRSKRPWLARLPGNQLFQVDFAERTYRLARLPTAWDGLSILHLSDLHFHGTPDRAFFEQVFDLCRDWQPDLVALTGDVVDSSKHHRWILPLLGRLTWNVAAFAILGNHDYWRDPPVVRRRLRRAGFRVLDNRWEQIDVRGQPMVVIGHEGPWFPPAPDLSACPAGAFRLCLSHTPDNMPWARRHGIDLVLAGHNHGGQIRFPVIGSVLVPSVYSRRYDCGSFHEPPTVLHVSRGLAGQHPLRFNCRPEVTKVILRRDPSAGPAAG
jgi:predicted MPP superfamily phosphohydrolase